MPQSGIAPRKAPSNLVTLLAEDLKKKFEWCRVLDESLPKMSCSRPTERIEKPPDQQDSMKGVCIRLYEGKDGIGEVCMACPKELKSAEAEGMSWLAPS